MQSRPLVIITTRLYPQICGVGTFSWLLHQHWPGDASHQKFFVVDGAGDSRAAVGFSDISEFGGDWKTLGRALHEAGAVDVLLHYAGRGYNRFGCPIGLPAIVQKWKARFPQSRLVIFFHEVPGVLPLTSRHYLLNLCNRRIVARLANAADGVVTNTAEHARTLEKLSRHTDVPWLPVPSNIESPVQVQEKKASSEFVIFGLPFSRWQALQAFDSDIRRWQQQNILTKLHLVGPSDHKFDDRSDALIMSYAEPDTVVRHSELPAEEVSRLLSWVRFALTTATASTWSKSATLMAFLAHGCSIVTNSKFSNEPLRWAVAPNEVGKIADTELESRADAARAWYRANADWKIFAAKICDLFRRLPPT